MCHPRVLWRVKAFASHQRPQSCSSASWYLLVYTPCHFPLTLVPSLSPGAFGQDGPGQCQGCQGPLNPLKNFYSQKALRSQHKETRSRQPRPASPSHSVIGGGPVGGPVGGACAALWRAGSVCRWLLLHLARTRTAPGLKLAAWRRLCAWLREPATPPTRPGALFRFPTPWVPAVRGTRTRPEQRWDPRARQGRPRR